MCAITRATVRVPKDPGARTAKQPGEMVHVDSWGPYPIEGFDGTHYFLFLTDDFTRYTWCGRYDTKDQLFKVFVALVKTIQKRYDITLRLVRLDGEFARGPIGKWCGQKNISLEPIEPYAHYQNGVAERNNRTIREIAAPMVQETAISGQVSKIIIEKGTEILRVSSIPENLWPEAVQYATWLKNRAPARALRKKEAKTPYEALRGYKPDLSRERVWGSRAYVTYPLEFRARAVMTKLHNPRGWMGYFVGCESEAMYLVYSPQKHKVYRIGVARVEDGEGLDDPHDAPCLEDRVPTPTVEIPEQAEASGNESDDLQGDEDADELDGPDQSPGVAAMANDGGDEDAISPSQSEEEDADDEEDNKYERNKPTRSRLKLDQFAFPKVPYENTLGITADQTIFPRRSRKATHSHISENDVESSSDEDYPDSWYYSDDGKPSQAYLKFRAGFPRGTKVFMPDDEKCERCYVRGHNCDMGMNGAPCTTCKNGNSICRLQSKRTKRLVLPENRDKKKKVRSGVPQDPSCRTCFLRNSSCRREGPAGTTCTNCQAMNVRCNWDLTGPTEGSSDPHAIVKAKRKADQMDKYGFIPVQKEDKCLRCAKQGRRCNGRQPCNTCDTPTLRNSCFGTGLT